MRDIRIRAADPAGNITVFVLDHADRNEYAAIARQILADGSICAEQVAFVTGDGSMEMCGQEFCGNASRAFALMCCEGQINYSDHGSDSGTLRVPVRVSGAQGQLEADVMPETGYVSISMPLHRNMLEYRSGLDDEGGRDAVAGTLVDFGGIMHLVLEDTAADDELFRRLRQEISEKYDPPAMGVMFCSGDSMTPVVYVRDVDTVYHEGSCASGTTAAVIARSCRRDDGRYTYRIKQPGGTLDAEAEVRSGRVTEVRIGSCITLGNIQVIAVE